MANWSEVRKRLTKDANVAKELENNEVEYQLVREIIKSRIEKNMTQKQLAELVGTRQSNISRLESGEYNPSITLLKKVAKAVDKELCISLK
jgi:DNA-binding XRE family transcriptional regulator